MKQYSLISGDVSNELAFVTEVNHLISNGWECLGGVVYVSSNAFTTDKLYQTMVRDRLTGELSGKDSLSPR